MYRLEILGARKHEMAWERCVMWWPLIQRVCGRVLKNCGQNPAFWFVSGKKNVLLSRIIEGQRYSLDPTSNIGGEL